MTPPQPIGPKRLWAQLLLALGYLAMVAGGVSEVTDRPYLLVLAVVAVGAVSLCVLALTWLTLWALNDNWRPGQFSIGSMMFLAMFVAVFFGVIRWLVDNSRFLNGDQHGFQTFAFVAAACLVATAVAIPFLLLMTESLLWASVWLVRSNRVQQWLARRRRS